LFPNDEKSDEKSEDEDEEEEAFGVVDAAAAVGEIFCWFFREPGKKPPQAEGEEAARVREEAAAACVEWVFGFGCGGVREKKKKKKRKKKKEKEKKKKKKKKRSRFERAALASFVDSDDFALRRRPALDMPATKTADGT